MKLQPSILGTIAAIFLAALAAAQTPSPAPAHDHDHSAPDPSGVAIQAKTTDQSNQLTLTGCLMRQNDVPATRDTSKSGASGFVLVRAQAVSHHQNSAGMRAAPTAHTGSALHAHDAPQTATNGPTVVPPIDSALEPIADSQMFKLAGVPLEHLTKMNGRRVQVDGHIDLSTVVDTTRDSKGRSPGDLGAPTFVVVSLDGGDELCPTR